MIHTARSLPQLAKPFLPHKQGQREQTPITGGEGCRRHRKNMLKETSTLELKFKELLSLEKDK